MTEISEPAVEAPPPEATEPSAPATMPGFHAGRRPRNKGVRYPATASR